MSEVLVEYVDQRKTAFFTVCPDPVEDHYIRIIPEAPEHGLALCIPEEMKGRALDMIVDYFDDKYDMQCSFYFK